MSFYFPEKVFVYYC